MTARKWWAFGALGWMVTIYFLSAQHTIHGPDLFSFQDKVAHALIYGVLGWLLARALYFKGELSVRRVLIVVILAAFFGITDEFHQWFVPGRNADALDWVADTAGAFLVVFALYVLGNRRANALRPGAA